jgi:hypothetical protein
MSEVLDVTQVAQILKVSTLTMRREIRDGHLYFRSSYRAAYLAKSERISPTIRSASLSLRAICRLAGMISRATLAESDTEADVVASPPFWQTWPERAPARFASERIEHKSAADCQI